MRFSPLPQGGYETTANSAALAVFEGLQRPEWVERLRADTDAMGDHVFSSYAVESKVALAMWKESVRLHSPTPGGTVRLTTQDTRLGPYLIPAGVGVLAPQHVFHRSEKNFEDPDSYRPERFLPNSPLGGVCHWQPFSLGNKKTSISRCALSLTRFRPSQLCRNAHCLVGGTHADRLSPVAFSIACGTAT
jgi:cytochrome P450